MLAATFLVVTATLRWRAANGSSVVSPSTIDEFACLTDSWRFDVEVYNRTWRSVSVRAANLGFYGQCSVNVTWKTTLERRQPELSPLLLLVKVQRLRCNPLENSFYAFISNRTLRTNNYCEAAPCNSTYLWASQSVELYLQVKKPLTTLASYDAAFLVTKATNVCGLANRSGELLVQNSGSSEYAFASDSRHAQLPPNNVVCTFDSNYSLTIRSSVVSASLRVTVLACPSNNSCETFLLNGHSCSDRPVVASAPPGSPVMLHYLLHRCSNRGTFSGFVVIAHVSESATPTAWTSTAAASSRWQLGSAVNTTATTGTAPRVSSLTPSSSSARSSSAVTGSSSAAFGVTGYRVAEATSSPRPSTTSVHFVATTRSLADATAERGLTVLGATDERTGTIVAASVAAVAGTALAIGLTAALLCRRRHRRGLLSPGQKAPVRAVPQARSTASASVEKIAMLDNDLYGVTLASTTAAHQ